MVKHLRRRVRGERGAAAVEFALVLPILLSIVLGIIAFGFIFASQISLNSAARDAARAGVVQPLSGTGLNCADIAKLARASSHPLGGDAQSVDVTVRDYNNNVACTFPAGNTSPSAGATTKFPCSGSNLSADPLLSVQLTYVSKMPFRVPYLPGSSEKPLTADGSFQCEYN